MPVKEAETENEAENRIENEAIKRDEKDCSLELLEETDHISSKPFDTLDDLGSCVNIIVLYLFKKLNIRLLEETDHIFGLVDRTKSYPTEKSLPKPFDQSPPLEISSKEKVQGISSTCTISMTLDEVLIAKGITKTMINGKAVYELKGKFLDNLRKNAFNRTNGEDVIEHTENFLKIFYPLDLPNVETYEGGEDEIAKIFRIKTDVFNYETPLCKEFNEFNYLFQIDPDLLTKDVPGFKTYDKYKDDWLYEWNNGIPWVHEKPWTDDGVWKKPAHVEHSCEPFNFKSGCS
ncbi:hypothetical protein Tco_0386092 [Tanacetum coccineum]